MHTFFYFKKWIKTDRTSGLWGGQLQQLVKGRLSSSTDSAQKFRSHIFSKSHSVCKTSNIYVKHLGKMNIHFVLFVLLFLRTESSHEKLKYDPLDATLYPTVDTRADSRFSLISVAYMHLSLFRVCLSGYLYLNVSYICCMSVYVLWAICVSLSLSLSLLPPNLPPCRFPTLWHSLCDPAFVSIYCTNFHV